MKIIKVLLIISVVFAAMFFSSIYILHEWFIYPPEYHMQIQQLIEKGYLNADFTYSEKIDFCENIEPTLGETYRNVCLWMD